MQKITFIHKPTLTIKPFLQSFGIPRALYVVLITHMLNQREIAFMHNVGPLSQLLRFNEVFR